MANYINMQQDEYDAVQTSLEALHADILSGEAAIREKIAELVQMDGGFHVKEISEGIERLLLTMQWIMTVHITDTFTNTEEAIASYVDAVIQIDVVDD